MKIRKLINKKCLFLLLTTVFLAGFLFTVSSQTAIKGDVNKDGRVDIIDALLIARLSAGYNVGILPKDADLNCDGVFNINDALIAVRYSAGLLVSITCPPTPTPSPFCTPCSVGVNGSIMDGATKKLVNDALIKLKCLDYGAETSTTGGSFSIYGPSCNGSEHVSFEVTKTGYRSLVIEQVLKCSQINEWLVTILPLVTPTPTPTPTFTTIPPCTSCEMTVSGKVTIAGSGQPVSGATIDFYTGRTTGITTDANGNYTLKLTGTQPGNNCPYADFMLVARASNFSDKVSGIIGFECSYAYPQDFVLTPLMTTAPVRRPDL